MKIGGIVSEYNPFHSGHAYHIRGTRAALGHNAAIVCVMSGNWVQRGEAAIADKWTRAALALRGGADLVLELPTVWAAASAEHFARGAVSILCATGAVDVLSFGSESGDITGLQRAADCLLSERYRAELVSRLEKGVSYAAARQSAAAACIGEGAALLTRPNNNLAVEYLKALRQLGEPMGVMTVPRVGAGHDSPGTEGGYTSASALRRMLLDGRWDEAAAHMPGEGAKLLQEGGLASLNWCSRGVLARLKTLPSEVLAALPDSSEGLHNRLSTAIRKGRSLEEIYEVAKTKRYAHARIRRMVLWAFLGLGRESRPDSPLYIKVLGMNGRGRTALRRMGQTARLPIVTKPAHVKKLTDRAAAFFSEEARCTDLYNLCRRDLSHAACGMEYTKSPVVIG